MADISTNPALSLTAPFTNLFAAIGNGLLSLAESTAKVRQMEALMALSDAQLADRGLKRSEIAQFVFRDAYWT